jgi:serine protease Do
LVGHHPQLEVALLRIDVAHQPHFELRSQKTVKPGEPVYALSNLFGVATGNEPVSVQRGVVAALAEVVTQRGARSFGYRGPALIVDAMINNPGAAGGAITDLDGNLLGVIGRESRSASSGLWLNFAIPVDQVAAAVDQIQTGNALQSATVPDKPAEPMTLELMGLRLVPEIVASTPPWIEQVIANGPAARAGLRSDDLIIAVNDVPASSLAHLKEQIGAVDRDSRLTITVQRGAEFLTMQIDVR